jgi:EAL domain-containing protein (putative c-di-GMP-specific phosphodiesterase class I)/ActR/RegA family two-component response regulator
MLKGRLLILDDDLAVGQTLALVGEGIGMESRLTTGVEEFFAALDEWNPTHITVDLVMPEMDGIEVMRRLSARECRARIIISSGVGDRILDAARRSATEHGLDIVGVLPKPFRPSNLRAMLEVRGAKVDVRTGHASGAQGGFEVTETALIQALDRREFQLVYQPKVECKSGALAGFEALVRWHHPVAGILMPDQFIRLAENWNLIDALTRQVLDLALRWLSQSTFGSKVSIAVNISAKSLIDPWIVDLACDICRKVMLDPNRLIFELTESSAMIDAGTGLDLLTQLRVKGFQLSIDDFGTGHSSMVQLVDLPFSEIKVDKSFVSAALRSMGARTVTKSVVDLGHNFGLLVTAEGVEDAATLEFLNTIGCDLAQGYFIGRPMTADVIADWIVQWYPPIPPKST